MFTVNVWNQFNINFEKGKMVISVNVEAANVTDAMDKVQEMASTWNKEAAEDMQANFITCKGFIRTI